MSSNLSSLKQHKLHRDDVTTFNLKMLPQSIDIVQDFLLVGYTSPYPTIEIVDIISGETLASFMRKTESESIEVQVVFKVLPNKRIFAAIGDRCHLLVPLPQGSILFDSILNKKLVSPDHFQIELPVTDAKLFVDVIGPLLNDEERVKLQSQIIVNDSLKNKHLKYTTVTLSLDTKIVPLLNSLVESLSNSEALSILYSVLETTKVLSSPDATSKRNFKPEDMNSEFNRLKSYTFWPQLKSVNPASSPQTLSQCGFYHDPKIERVKLDDGRNVYQGHDRVVNYCCKGFLSSWEYLEHPWKELQKLHPSCPFITGKPSTNIPIAFTLAAMRPICDNGGPIIHFGTSQHTDILITASEDGVIVVWDTMVELRKLFMWSSRTGTLIKDPSKYQHQQFQLLKPDGDPERDGKLTSVQLVECAPQKNEKKGDKEEKWVDWCTTGIEVYVSKGSYNEVKGTVFDLFSEDTICVYIEGFGEIVNMPLSHLQPFRTQPKQHVKVLQSKEYKGETGLVLSLQSNTAVVRLDSDNSIISISTTSLAPLAGSQSQEKFEETVIDDCCVISVYTLPNKSSVNVYQITGKEPKYMQCLQNDNCGEAISSVYLAELQKLFVLYKLTPESASLVLTSFDFQPEHRRLAAHSQASLSFSSVSDAPVSLSLLEVTPGFLSTETGRLIVITSQTGELVLVDPLSLKDVIRLDPPIHDETKQQDGEELVVEEYKRLLILEGDDQIRCLTKSGKIVSFSVSKQQEEGIGEKYKDVDLGEVNEENLQSFLSKFDLFELKYRSSSPSGCKQIMLDNECVSWRLPQAETVQGELCYTFMIEFPCRSTIDDIRLDLVFSRPWCMLDSDATRVNSTNALTTITGQVYKYAVTLKRHTPTGFESLLHKFDLTRLIMDNESSLADKKQKTASLNVDITARALELTLHYIPQSSFAGKTDQTKPQVLYDFVYSKDFDNHGLLYWLGTDGYTVPYQNPATTRKVHVILIFTLSCVLLEKRFLSLNINQKLGVMM